MTQPLCMTPPPADPAVADTAHATWQLVYATYFLGILTVLVVAAAFLVPWMARKADRKKELEELADLNFSAGVSIKEARDFAIEIRDLLKSHTKIPQEDLWELLNRRHTEQRNLDYYLSLDLRDLRSTYRLSAATQALFEIESALTRMNPKSAIAAPQATRDSAAATARRAVERLDRAETRITSLPMHSSKQMSSNARSSIFGKPTEQTGTEEPLASAITPPPPPKA